MSEMCAEGPCSSSRVPGPEMKHGASSPPWRSVTKAFLGQEASPSLFLAYEAKPRENFKTYQQERNPKVQCELRQRLTLDL